MGFHTTTLSSQAMRGSSLLGQNPRVMDCKTALDIYNTIVKPYCKLNNSWVSSLLPSLCIPGTYPPPPQTTRFNYSFLSPSLPLQISPQITRMLAAVEGILTGPGSHSRMAEVARVLGERRLCRMDVTLAFNGGVLIEPTVFCVEQEIVAQALQPIREIVSCPAKEAYHTCFILLLLPGVCTIVLVCTMGAPASGAPHRHGDC